MDQFSIDIVSSDYKVKPVVIQEDFAILVGVRPLFFHFVVIQSEGSANFRHIKTNQFHLHKFDLASEYFHLKSRVEKNDKKERLYIKSRDCLQMSLDQEMNYWMTLDFLGFEVKIERDTGQWFLDILEKEMKRVISSIKNLSAREHQVELLEKLQLPVNGEYDFESIVWRCMQFELNLFARNKNKIRGISSLYPHLLKVNGELSEIDLNRIADVLDLLDPFCNCEFCREYAAMFDKAHNLYFPQKIYIRGKQKFSLKKIKEGVRLMYARLSPADQISLIYLLDYSPFILITLSYFNGLETEQELISLLCRDFQPDSKEEQKTREQISLISWFRKIAGTQI